VMRGRSAVGRVDLVTARAVPGAGALRMVTSFFGGPWPSLIVLVTLAMAAFLALRLRVRASLHRRETGAR
jgi:hypothetical protein